MGWLRGWIRTAPAGRLVLVLAAASAAVVGALEASASVVLEAALKRVYLEDGAGWIAVIVALVDTTAVPRAIALYAAAGAAGGLVVAALLAATERRHGARRSAGGAARAVAALAALGAGLVLEAVAVRRGWPGALWPPRPPALADAVAVLGLVCVVAGIGRVARRFAAALDRRDALAPGLARAVAAGVVLCGALAGLAVAARLAAPAPGAATAQDLAATGPAPARPHVLLVVLDTARADRFSLFGADRLTSPALAALAARGATFEQAWAPAPWTLPSHGSLFTGELPHRHGARWGRLALAPTMHTLAERFREVGYRTAAFTNNPWIGPLSGLDRGFDELHPMWRDHGGPWDRLLGVRVVRRISGVVADEGAVATRDALGTWLAGAVAQPLFVFVNLMELHDPNWPAPGAERFLTSGVTRSRLRGLNQSPYQWFAGLAPMTDEDFGLLVDLYDAQVAYVDARLGELLALWEARVGRDRSVVAVVGDHGENLGDHGAMSHVFSMAETLLRVPFVLVAPGRVPAGERVTAPVSTVDLAPTLEDLAGLAAAGSPGRWGRSLLAERDGTAWAEPRELLIAEHERPLPILDILRSLAPALDLAPFDRSWVAVRRGPRKLVLASDGAATLYDLGADPVERAGGPPAVASDGRSLHELAAAALAAVVAAQPGDGGTPVLDPASEERLRALGYVP